VRRASGVALADRTRDERVLYDVVLLAGTPKRLTLRLAPEIASEWMVADVRPAAGAPAQLICIYAV